MSRANGGRGSLCARGYPPVATSPGTAGAISVPSAAADSGPGPGWRDQYRTCCLLRDEPGGTGQIAACVSRCPVPSSWPGVLCGAGAGAVQDAGGGADVHVQGGADVGVAGHGGDVGGVELPGEQGGGAQHVPQAVPDPLAVAAGVAPAGRQVGGGQDAAVEVGGPPV